MDFLSLPDEILIEMMVSKLSLRELSNLIKTNKRLFTLFQDIKSNEHLYRQYLDSHFPHLEEQSIITIDSGKYPIYILFPYKQEVYGSDDENIYKKKFIGNSIISMEKSFYFSIIYLTNMGEIYI